VILLLDAHAVYWWISDDPTLSTEARAAIADPLNDVLVSAASIWELAIKRAAGRIDLPADLTAAIDELGFSSLPVTALDAEAAAALPLHHRDPFDRMLIAQARRLSAVLVTRDAVFRTYSVEALTA
jgi:PIN domain nuclease of toxin-antitoxin system